MTETTKMIKAIANDSKVRIDRIVANYEQLEKENEELKDQLTKAKEIIKDLLLVADNKMSQMGFELCVADAKQFLKE